MLTVLPIRYVADVAASRRFYTGLGLALRPDLSVDVWVHLSAGAGAVGIHDALGFTTDEPLEAVADRLNDAGYAYELVDENFGRSLRITDPDGVIVQIQEIDQDTVRRSAEGRREPRP